MTEMTDREPVASPDQPEQACQEASDQHVRQSEMTYRGFFENASEGFFQSTPEGQFLIVNPALVDMLGYDHPEELLSLDIANNLWVDSAAREEYKRFMEEHGRVSKFEMKLKKRDGNTIIVRESARAIKDEQGRVICHEGILEDVTEQKRAEEEARQRNRELLTLYGVALAMSGDPSVKSILHNALFELTRVLDVPFGCIYIRHDQTLVLRSFHGVTQDELGLPAELDPVEHPWLKDTTVIRGRHATNSDMAWEQALGVQAWISVPLRSKNELIGVIQLASPDADRFTSANISLIIAVANQVVVTLENARLYDQMRESEQKYRSIFDNVSVGLYQTTPEGRILTVNPALVQLLGYESTDALLAVDLLRDIYVDPADRNKNLRLLRQDGRFDGLELRLRRKDGQKITVLNSARTVFDAGGNVLCFEGMMIDITEKKALEQQLLQAQKMESIGTLAGGIAHEFNNLLTGILGYASLILDQIGPQDCYYQPLRIIEQSARRGAQLTDKMLAFSRQSISQFQPMDVNSIVNDMMTLIRPTLDASIDMDVKLNAKPGVVQADSMQIQQVLVGLCINARDAMPAGGLITVETFNARLDEADARGHVDAYPGEFVVMRVSDMGVGIAPEHLPRIFDPFFSTKDVDRGTGLGLSTAYGIIKSHSGFILVESQPGQGARFSIYLPVTQEAVKALPSVLDPCVQQAATILVVDDEPIIRDLAKAILERNHLTVMTADGGSEALKVYEGHRHHIDLVLLDLTMPKMSGRLCFQELRRLNPDVRVLLSSGYSGDDRVQDLLVSPMVGFIQKPYLADDLTDAVRRMLAKS